MAVLSRNNLVHGQRIDVHDLKAIDSYVASDFRALIKFICGNNPYIVNGCKITNKIGSKIFVSRSDLFLFLPNHESGAFYKEPNSSPDIELELPSSGKFFIELNLKRETGTALETALWDSLATTPENENGTEFQALVDSEDFITMEVSYNINGFSSGALPIATVDVSSGVVTHVVDNRNIFFRSGSGGLHPSLQYTKPFSLNRQTPSLEGVEVGDNLNSPFRDRDGLGALNPAAFTSLKDWIDGIATVLSEIQGVPVWYASTGASQIVDDLNLKTLFNNSEQGHSIEPQDDVYLLWNRGGDNNKDYKLRTDGTSILRWRQNYTRIYWELGGSFSSDRVWDSTTFTTSEIPDGANVYIELYNDMIINDNQVNFGSSPSGLIASNRSISGIANDFTGVAVGDFVRKNGDIKSWFQVVGYVNGGVLNEPIEGTLVPSTATELKVDLDISSSGSDLFRFFKTRYSVDDIKIESSSLIERINGDYQSMQYYWLGRRNGDNFVLRQYGMLSPGEATRTLNDKSDNPSRPQNINVRTSNARFQTVSGVPQVRYYSGSYMDSTNPVINITKQVDQNWVNNDGSNNESSSFYTIAADSSHALFFVNDGDELWANLSNDNGNFVLSPGSLEVTNNYEVRTKDDSPVASYSNKNLHLIARRQDINGTPYLFFTDGVILGDYGDTELNNKVYTDRVVNKSGRVVNLVSTAIDYSLLLSDELLMVEKPSGATLTVTLPDTTNEECLPGTLFEIKDANNSCNVNSVIKIVVNNIASETIDGDTEAFIESEGEALKIVYKGNSRWGII